MIRPVEDLARSLSIRIPPTAFCSKPIVPYRTRWSFAKLLGHVDFFKNNVYFSKTNRAHVESVSTHARRIMEYEFKLWEQGGREVSRLGLAIEENISIQTSLSNATSLSKRRNDAPNSDRETVVMTILESGKREDLALRFIEQANPNSGRRDGENAATRRTFAGEGHRFLHHATFPVALMGSGSRIPWS